MREVENTTEEAGRGRLLPAEPHQPRTAKRAQHIVDDVGGGMGSLWSNLTDKVLIMPGAA